MKQFLLFTLFLFLCIPSIGAKKPKPVLHNQLVILNKTEGKASNIKFTCGDVTTNKNVFIGDFKCSNNTDERIFIEWENARINNNRIIFGDDSRMTMKNTKADEAVSPKSISITRDLMGEDQVGSDDVKTLFFTYPLKKDLSKKAIVEIKIPVRFADNTVVEYNLEFRVWYEMPESEDDQ